jgi:hypothetical protein
MMFGLRLFCCGADDDGDDGGVAAGADAGTCGVRYLRLVVDGCAGNGSGCGVVALTSSRASCQSFGFAPILVSTPQSQTLRCRPTQGQESA